MTNVRASMRGDGGGAPGQADRCSSAPCSGRERWSSQDVVAVEVGASSLLLPRRHGGAGRGPPGGAAGESRARGAMLQNQEESRTRAAMMMRKNTKRSRTPGPLLHPRRK